MQKPLAQNGKLDLGQGGAVGMTIAAVTGIALLVAEGAVLRAQRIPGAAYALVAVFVPAALLGAWFGLRIFKRLSDRRFELVVNALLVLSGIGLIL